MSDVKTERFKANNEKSLMKKVRHFMEGKTLVNIDCDIQNYYLGSTCEQMYFADVSYKEEN